MPVDILETAWSLKQQDQPFVLATVIRIEKPTSSKPGAKAIISADGTLTGWVGGSCAEPTVKKEARRALETGEPRLIRLCPPEMRNTAPQQGVIEVELTCISGGTLEIYLEPYMPQPHLIIVGHHEITSALVQQGKSLGYRVTVMSMEPINIEHADAVLEKLDFAQVRTDPNTAVIVCSHGNYDEIALVEALKSDASYVALVASKKRLEAVRQYLKDSELTEEQIGRLKCPAGLDIGAVTPPEIALSIVAEIINTWHVNPPVWHLHEQAGQQGPTEAIDPVCHMTVEIATARYISEYNGQKYYFCNAGCQKSFERKPEEYLQRG
jgi:xanthine dehydrogenase accessory factor